MTATLELRNAQRRILKTLARAKGPMNAATLCDRAEFDQAWVGEYLGSHNVENREKIETRSGFPSLASLKLIKITELDLDGKTERCYELTAKGRKVWDEIKAGGTADHRDASDKNFQATLAARI
jgi:DNA-binding MarR family transcriptional regulator